MQPTESEPQEEEQSVTEQSDNHSPTIPSQTEQTSNKPNIWKKYLKIPAVFLVLKTNPGYRYLWLGYVISMLGDWFTFVAVIKVINDNYPSTIGLSIFLLCRLLPPSLLVPVIGVIADRFDRRVIMLMSDIIRIFGSMGYTLAALFPKVFWIIYFIVALQSSMQAFFDACRSSTIPVIVTDPKELVAANTLDGVTWSVSAAISSALGGLVVGTVGVYPNFVIDGCSFFLSGCFVSMLFWLKVGGKQPAENTKVEDEKLEEEKELEDMEDIENKQQEKSEQQVESEDVIEEQDIPKERKPSAFQMIKEVLIYLKDNPDNALMCVPKSCSSFMWAFLDVAMIRMAEKDFVIGTGAQSLGILYSVYGVGAFIWPIFLGKLVDTQSPLKLRLLFIIGLTMQSIGALSAGWSPNFFVFFAFGAFLRVGGESTVWVYVTTILQKMTPDYVRGRVFSIENAIRTFMEATGSISVGLLFDYAKWDGRMVQLVVGGVGVVITLLWFFAYFLLWRRRFLKQSAQEPNAQNK